ENLMQRFTPEARIDQSPSFVPAPRRFLDTAARQGKAPAYYVRTEKSWVPTSWSVYRDEVRQAARALIALGVKPGDAIAVWSYNRPEWMIIDVAAMMIGASVAGIYFTSSPQDAAYIINHAQCEFVLLENRDYFKRLSCCRHQLNITRHFVMMRGAPAP